MATSITFNLLLTDFDNIQEINVYRSETPHDTSALGTPYATIPKSTVEYTDPDATFGSTYYYLLESVFTSGDKRYSSEEKVTVGEMIYLPNNANKTYVFNFDGHYQREYQHVNAGDICYIDCDSKGNMYIGGNAHTFEARDQNNNQIWNSSYSTSDIRDMVYGNNGIVYAFDQSGYISKVNALDGSNVSRIRPTTGTTTRLFVDDQYNMYSTHSGEIYVYGDDDAYMWHHSPHASGTIYSILVDPEGFVYTGSSSNEIKKFKYDGVVGTENFNPYSFTDEWSRTLDSTVWDIKRRSEYPDEIYVLTQAKLYILNKNDGTIISEFDTTGVQGRRLSVTEMKYFIVTEHGTSSNGLFMFKPDGTLFWHETVMSKNSAAYDTAILPGKQSIAYGFHQRSTGTTDGTTGDGTTTP